MTNDSLIALIESAKSKYVNMSAEYNHGLDKAIDIIRQHFASPDVVEEAALKIANIYQHSNMDMARQAAIAAMGFPASEVGIKEAQVNAPAHDTNCPATYSAVAGSSTKHSGEYCNGKFDMGDASTRKDEDGYSPCARNPVPDSPAIHEVQKGIERINAGDFTPADDEPREISDNGEDVRAGYYMGFEAGKAFIFSNNSFCPSSVSDKIVCPSKLGDFELQLNADPKFRRASLRPVMLDKVAALFINLDHPKWLPVAEVLKAGLLSAPMPVSLAQCVANLKLSSREHETHEEMAKAVLDAAGVTYVD